MLNVSVNPSNLAILIFCDLGNPRWQMLLEMHAISLQLTFDTPRMQEMFFFEKSATSSLTRGFQKKMTSGKKVLQDHFIFPFQVSIFVDASQR